MLEMQVRQVSSERLDVVAKERDLVIAENSPVAAADRLRPGVADFEGLVDGRQMRSGARCCVRALAFVVVEVGVVRRS